MKETGPIGGHAEYAENPEISHYQGFSSAPESFDAEPEPTTLPISTRRATDMQPEQPAEASAQPPEVGEPPEEAPEASEASVAPAEITEAQKRLWQPVATTRERVRPMDKPIPTFVRIPGQPAMVVRTPDWVTQGLGKMIATTQAEIDAYRSDSSGLDNAGIQAFTERLGMNVTDKTYEIDISERPAVVDSIRTVAAVDGEMDAMYVPFLDAVITFRNPELESINGPAYTDINRVHELTHSDGDARVRAVWDGETVDVRNHGTGLIVQGLDHALHNKMLEEGRAEYVAIKYAVEQLGLPHGVTGLSTDTTVVPLHMSDGGIAVPTQYARFDTHGSLEVSTPSFAAIALEHLMERDPALEPAIIHSGSNPEARRELIGRINAIDKGLYQRLRDGYNTYESFEDGLQHVRAILGI